ncbi:hypothetical protein QBC39DRAFT_345530 [Podospora conica]|nr:hypothetical protein QBC39DRAFT_345530 [Schizothecium conicum]
MRDTKVPCGSLQLIPALLAAPKPPRRHRDVTGLPECQQTPFHPRPHPTSPTINLTHLQPPPLNILIIGASGYLGTAISRAPHRAFPTHPGRILTMHGLVRRASAAPVLATAEILPVVVPPSPIAPLPLPLSSPARAPGTSSSRAPSPPAMIYALGRRGGARARSRGRVRRDPAAGAVVVWVQGLRGVAEERVGGRLAPHGEGAEVVMHPITEGRTEAGVRKEGRGGGSMCWW